MSELEIVSSIQQTMTATPLAIAVSVFLARWLVFAYVVIGIALFIGRDSRRRHAVRDAVWSAGIALATTTVISSIIGRLRPYLQPLDIFAPVTLFVPEPLNAAFPSGHTAVSFAIAAALFTVDRRLGYLGVLIGFCVALGRVAVGVHFPSDIVGGIIVGVGSAMVVQHLHARVRTRDLKRAAKRHHHA